MYRGKEPLLSNYYALCVQNAQTGTKTLFKIPACLPTVDFVNLKFAQLMKKMSWPFSRH